MNLSGAEIAKAMDSVLKHLGIAGRLVGGSKSFYMSQNPDHKVWFNACLFKDGLQIWYGDIDFDTDADALQNLKKDIGAFSVTKETPFRWDGLEEGRKKTPDGVIDY